MEFRLYPSSSPPVVLRIGSVKCDAPECVSHLPTPLDLLQQGGSSTGILPLLSLLFPSFLFLFPETVYPPPRRKSESVIPPSSVGVSAARGLTAPIFAEANCCTSSSRKYTYFYLAAVEVFTCLGPEYLYLISETIPSRRGGARAGRRVGRKDLQADRGNVQ